ncbi:hypothetical protein [Xanthobacter sp. KR7-225]|uniref:hypothetical protein n=1 Tax=Xanthobacter sp. KR7-225 TaxID=3156613 RepID=UPI0032B369D1
MFDTRVRHSGISFVYQFPGMFARGLAPIIATELLRVGDTTPWLVALTKGLARELGPLGIAVNAIAPSVADPPIAPETLPGSARAIKARGDAKGASMARSGRPAHG